MAAPAGFDRIAKLQGVQRIVLETGMERSPLKRDGVDSFLIFAAIEQRFSATRSSARSPAAPRV